MPTQGSVPAHGRPSAPVAATFDCESFVPRDPAAATFSRELRPIASEFVPAALAVSDLDRLW